MGTLFVVSTPIGNLKDITFRALEVLKEVDLVLAEDTRKTGFLLAHYQIKKPLLSYFEGNEERRIPEIIKRLAEGHKIALVTNAGTPLLSDPGFKLVRECRRLSIKIEPIPGASAVLAALVASGLPTDKFLFLGYLPKKQTKRKKFLESLKDGYQYLQPSVVFYESPHRLAKTLLDIKEIFGNISLVIASELTKIHEKVQKLSVQEAINILAKEKPKGEVTLVFSLKD